MEVGETYGVGRAYAQFESLCLNMSSPTVSIAFPLPILFGIQAMWVVGFWPDDRCFKLALSSCVCALVLFVLCLPSPRHTHPDRPLVVKRTLKYFIGILNRAWIVNTQWIRQSLASGMILDEVMASR